MSAANPLQKLTERGQSIWLDYISRELVTTGQLRRLIDESMVTGLTSNPTIFEKAIAEGSDYDQQLRELIAEGVDDPNDVFLALAISDIQHAADTLRPVWEKTQGGDGYVSLELPPSLSHDTPGSVETAKQFWQRVDRPNLMVKVPATPEGIPAIEELIGSGVNINVTLIFALTAYENVINAYIHGAERRRANQESLDVHSVASFFVSRVDTAVDKLIEEKLKTDPGNAILEGLLGKAAIANARLAYEMFEKHFRGEAFRSLAGAGAHLQRPLWASTSAKNPNYRDVVYAEALIGPDTVDTMPPATIEAFRDHGVVGGDTVRDAWEGAHQVIEDLEKVGISMEKVTHDLLDAGVKSFADSYNQLIARIADKMDSFRGGYAKRQHLHLAATTDTVMAAIIDGASREIAERIWKRDPELWKPGDEAHAAVIGNRLGWLDVIDTMRENLARLTGLAADVRDAGFTNAVLLGMGGSSLCPEVLRTSFGSAAGHPVLHVLDTTDPQAITDLGASIDPRSTLFIAASKSGTTLETSSHLAHFWQLVTATGAADPGRNFVAITDPGTSLAQVATERGFRHLFENPSDIGGRYSALSFFGLVPAAIAGIDVEQMLDRAANMRASCGAGTPAEFNPGLGLGRVFSLYHSAGRDKITILAPPRIAAFGLWAEQLIAESTGKEGKGLIPVGNEPIGTSSVYADDRLFVALQLGTDDSDFDQRVGALVAAGQPVVILELNDLYDLGAEFFRWEFATAVAAVSLQIDPFDEPNVQESKDNTKKVLSTYEQNGALPEDEVNVRAGDVGVYGGAEASSPEEALGGFLESAAAGDYVATMAYVNPTRANHEALQAFRTAIRDSRRVATTLGFGPRFLHSTGQLHKGGPNTGVFIQVTVNDPVDVEIPGQPFTFSVLKQAQARGDLESLRSHGRRVMRLHVGGDLAAGLSGLARTIQGTAGAAR